MADVRILLPLLLAAGACADPPDQRHYMPLADEAHGRQAIDRAGCGSCHTIVGVAWPEGKVGPRLEGLSDRALIAGRVPNTPENMAAFIRNAPAHVPGGAMPAMPVTEREARDITAYLYQPGH